MSESQPKPHIYERLRSRELTDKKKKEIGEVAVGSVIESNKEIVKAERLQRLGRRITAAAELRQHRKEIRDKKLYGVKTHTEFDPKMPGLKGALETRKEAVRKAKKEVMFAKKGYDPRTRRELLSQERENARASIIEEQGEPSGLGASFERLGIRKKAKAQAEATVRAREQAAADELELRQAELKQARARRDQTSSAYQMTKLHASGGKSNLVSTFKDAPKTTEERLASLQARGRVNQAASREQPTTAAHTSEVAELELTDEDIARLHSMLLGEEVKSHSGPEIAPERGTVTELPAQADETGEDTKAA